MSEYDNDDSRTKIELAETLQTLRRELQTAQLQAVNEGILFEIDKVELELKVVISRTKKAETGIQFYVVKAGGEIEKSDETTHTVKLTFKPIDKKTGESPQVSDKTTEKLSGD